MNSNQKIPTGTGWEHSDIRRVNHHPPSSKVTTTTPACWIHALPFELLSDILTAAARPKAVPLTDEAYHPGNPHITPPDFSTLAQLVCQMWRAVVLTTPALWSVLDFKKIRATNFPLLLERSGTLPLHIQITLPYGSNDSRSQPNVDHILQEHSSRITRLHLCGDGCAGIRGTIKALPTNLENLRDLAVNGGLSANRYAFAPGHLKLIAPGLRSLSVESYTLNWKTMPVSPDLEYLSVIETCSVPVAPATLFTALGQYPHLRVLQLERQDITRWYQDPFREPLVLATLERLVLRRFFMSEMRVFFKLLAAPELKELIVRRSWSGGHPDIGAVCPVLQFPALETLVLEGLDASLELAQQLVQVKHLALVGNRAIDTEEMERGFGKLRSYWRSLPEPLPLETLKTDNIKISSLISLLEDNLRATVPKLRKITVHYKDVFHSRDPQEFDSRAAEWSKLSALVQSGVYGISTGAIEARARVTSWEEEAEWFKGLDRLSVPSFWCHRFLSCGSAPASTYNEF